MVGGVASIEKARVCVVWLPARSVARTLNVYAPSGLSETVCEVAVEQSL